MFFRFGSAVFLVVVISLTGIAIEKRNLELRRQISHQHYRMDVLKEQHTRLRLRAQQLASIERLFDSVEDSQSQLTRPQQPAQDKSLSPKTGNRKPPLLFWQRPLADPRNR